MKLKNHRSILKYKPNFRVLGIMRKIERERGLQTEERFLNAMRNGNGNPEWYNGISKGTPKEDMEGKDFIVHTAFGNVFVQIKGSETGANKFFEKRKNKNFRIIVLVIKSQHKEEDIRNISFPAIQAEIDLFRKPFCS